MRSSLGLLVIMLLAAGVGVIAAHSQSQTVATPTAQPAALSAGVPQSRTVYMMGGGSGGSGASYVPATLTVRIGQKVTWVNHDVNGHTATADNGAFNSDVLNQGQHFSWTPKQAGTYSYSDYNQSDVRGTIIVKP